MFVRKDEWDEYSWHVNINEFRLLCKISMRIMNEVWYATCIFM